jgi:1,4-dihydroxy-2-naphthoate octaprenyltransferase
MTTPAEWVAGARPRTLGAALSPVIVGTAAAYADADTIVWWRAVAALVVALALQVGVNYANDYSDGVRGTDTKRAGPLRLTASGVAAPAAVRNAAALAFGVAAVVGLVLAIAVDPGPRRGSGRHRGGCCTQVARARTATGLAVAVLCSSGSWPRPDGARRAQAVPAAWWGSGGGAARLPIPPANNIRDVDTDRAAAAHAARAHRCARAGLFVGCVASAWRVAAVGVRTRRR